ncbi:Cyclin PHO80-like [Macleaya cordata]|uniref:Cyclin PHO80-like n=1 Tax=Macleaya cordata TaxID=56857 RepID=A0A200QQ72_MACCD|nr:Cyclin PHO80-like [Macleaya cordata]
MDSLAVEIEAIGSKIYLVLGLNKSTEGVVLGTPPVLSLLSSLLEEVVQKHEKLLETTKKKDDVTIFHSIRAPTLSIQQYMDRIFKYAGFSSSCFIVAYIYMDRFLQRVDVHLTSLNVHRLLITSLMIAAKFIDDSLSVIITEHQHYIYMLNNNSMQ